MPHWLDEPCATTAYVWTMIRRDGVALGFTSHDRDLVIDGLLHRAGPGMVPSAIVETAKLEGDGLDIDGGLSSAAISEADLDAGRWDGATLEIQLVDWTDTANRRSLAKGELGELSRSGGAFRAELRGPAAALDRPVAPRTSPGCRADFCGRECGLDAMRFTRDFVVRGIEGEKLTLGGLVDGGLYRFGRLRFLSGAACGMIHDIADGAGADIWLTEPPRLVLGEGVRAMLTQGCDRSIATCAGRFGNAVNFRGEPHLPGNDLLTRYPGGR
ncbi:DUF2163 domain-containing protein [Novosphingopyxis sp. YJ-S2-01]|uniref:DUF2163 domain-containing protein n=1 Tax=Novosphingopyxis sp. YJ-S2-01 TaxID=2794021 RepID=UPI0018DD6F93|nr:DUF2163 domain-containing protein [Novosphingopyxis sp. YJ-S2-01]MBH9537019.1 DUF2163 domain-containing protein [Novosphingopyxis sp. YJ-S2-01]